MGISDGGVPAAACDCFYSDANLLLLSMMPALGHSLLPASCTVLPCHVYVCWYRLSCPRSKKVACLRMMVLAKDCQRCNVVGNGVTGEMHEDVVNCAGLAHALTANRQRERGEASLDMTCVFLHLHPPGIYIPRT